MRAFKELEIQHRVSITTDHEGFLASRRTWLESTHRRYKAIKSIEFVVPGIFVAS